VRTNLGISVQDQLRVLRRVTSSHGASTVADLPRGIAAEVYLRVTFFIEERETVVDECEVEEQAHADY
jgi:hypothetical protein